MRLTIDWIRTTDQCYADRLENPWRTAQRAIQLADDAIERLPRAGEGR